MKSNNTSTDDDKTHNPDINLHLNLIRKIGSDWYKSYKPKWWSMDDCINQAWIESARILERYDSDKGTVSTFLYNQVPGYLQNAHNKYMESRKIKGERKTPSLISIECFDPDSIPESKPVSDLNLKKLQLMMNILTVRLGEDAVERYMFSVVHNMSNQQISEAYSMDLDSVLKERRMVHWIINKYMVHFEC